MNEILMIAGMAIVTFGIRYLMFGMSDRLTLSPAILNALRYVPPVVLTAIIVPAILMPTGETLEVSWENARLVGAIAAFTTGWFTKNLLWTIVIGMSTFLLWQWLV